MAHCPASCYELDGENIEHLVRQLVSYVAAVSTCAFCMYSFLTLLLEPRVLVPCATPATPTHRAAANASAPPPRGRRAFAWLKEEAVAPFAGFAWRMAVMGFAWSLLVRVSALVAHMIGVEVELGICINVATFFSLTVAANVWDLRLPTVILRRCACEIGDTAQRLAAIGRDWLIVPMLKAVVRVVCAAGPRVQEQGAHVVRFIAQLGAAVFEYFCLQVENACLFFLWLMRVVTIKIFGGVLRILLELVDLIIGSPVRRVLGWVMRNRPGEIDRLADDNEYMTFRIRQLGNDVASLQYTVAHKSSILESVTQQLNGKMGECNFLREEMSYTGIGRTRQRYNEAKQQLQATQEELNTTKTQHLHEARHLRHEISQLESQKAAIGRRVAVPCSRCTEKASRAPRTCTTSQQTHVNTKDNGQQTFTEVVHSGQQTSTEVTHRGQQTFTEMVDSGQQTCSDVVNTIQQTSTKVVIAGGQTLAVETKDVGNQTWMAKAAPHGIQDEWEFYPKMEVYVRIAQSSSTFDSVYVPAFDSVYVPATLLYRGSSSACECQEDTFYVLPGGKVNHSNWVWHEKSIIWEVAETALEFKGPAQKGATCSRCNQRSVCYTLPNGDQEPVCDSCADKPRADAARAALAQSDPLPSYGYRTAQACGCHA